MAENVSSPDVCYTEWYTRIGAQADYVVHYIAVPFYFFLSLFGHSIFLSLCISQLKTEKAYIYQILVTSSELAEVVFNSAYVVMNTWLSGQYWPSSKWYSSSYFCMWISAHLTLPLANGSLNMSQFLTISMAVDRFRALYHPFTYKSTSKRTYALIVLLCLGLSTGLSAFECFKAEVLSDGDESYKIDFYASDNELWSKICAHLRNAVTIAGILVLYFLNVSISVLYWKGLQKSKNIISTEKQKERQQNLKMLTILSTSTAILATFAECSIVGIYIYFAIQPPCLGSTVALAMSVTDGVFFVSTALKFYIIFALNRDFRALIIKHLRRSTAITVGS